MHKRNPAAKRTNTRSRLARITIHFTESYTEYIITVCITAPLPVDVIRQTGIAPNQNMTRPPSKTDAARSSNLVVLMLNPGKVGSPCPADPGRLIGMHWATRFRKVY